MLELVYNGWSYTLIFSPYCLRYDFSNFNALTNYLGIMLTCIFRFNRSEAKPEVAVLTSSPVIQRLPVSDNTFRSKY